MAAKKGLGKGLDSLITDKVSKPVKPKSNHAADAVMIDINKVCLLYTSDAADE